MVADQHAGVVSRSLYYTLLHVIFTDRVTPFSAVASPDYPAPFPSTKTVALLVTGAVPGWYPTELTDEFSCNGACSKGLYTHSHAHLSPIHATPYSHPKFKSTTLDVQGFHKMT